MYRDGIVELEKTMATAPGNALALSYLGYAYAVAGRRADAQKVLDQLNELSKQKYVAAGYMALMYEGLGEKDKVIRHSSGWKKLMRNVP